jgi:hypothetical protein
VKRISISLLLLLFLVHFSGAPLRAQEPGTGGESGPSSKEDDADRRKDKKQPAKPTKGIDPDDVDWGGDRFALGEEGEIPWIKPRLKDDFLSQRDARRKLKPVLGYFWKSPLLIAPGKKPPRDAAVKACDVLNKNLWSHPMIVETAREFHCFLVNVRDAPMELLEKYGVKAAPVIVVMDFDLGIWFTGKTKKVRPKKLLGAMDKAEKSCIKGLEKIASQGGEAPEVAAAAERLEIYKQRGLYRRGRELLKAMQWKKARELFEKAIDMRRESYWSDQSGVGCGEVDAGKEYQRAEFLCKKKKYEKAKEVLEHIISFWGHDDAPYFSQLARDKLEWVKAKLK